MVIVTEINFPNNAVGSNVAGIAYSVCLISPSYVFFVFVGYQFPPITNANGIFWVLEYVEALYNVLVK